MLWKSEDKLAQKVQLLHHYAAGIMQAPGPNHGFIVEAATAGIVVSLKQDGEIWIETPLGATMPVRTCHESHYKACIREACTYAAIKYLCDRNAKPGKKGGRQDMAGIQAFIDLHDTLALVSKKPGQKAAAEGTQKADGAEPWYLVKMKRT